MFLITTGTVLQVDSGEVIHCREQVAFMLHQHAGGNNKPAKRKVHADNEDDFYDGIKRLYNEEEMPVSCKEVSELPPPLAPHAMTVAN